MKHKARLCVHEMVQKSWDLETYILVLANWTSFRILMVQSTICDPETKFVDFVLAFPQAPPDVDMEPHHGFDLGGSKKFILKLNRNLYGLKDAGFKYWILL